MCTYLCVVAIGTAVGDLATVYIVLLTCDKHVVVGAGVSVLCIKQGALYSGSLWRVFTAVVWD